MKDSSWMEWRCGHQKPELKIMGPAQPLAFATIPFPFKDFLTATGAKNPSQKPPLLGLKPSCIGTT